MSNTHTVDIKNFENLKIESIFASSSTILGSKRFAAIYDYFFDDVLFQSRISQEGV